MKKLLFTLAIAAIAATAVHAGDQAKTKTAGKAGATVCCPSEAKAVAVKATAAGSTCPIAAKKEKMKQLAAKKSTAKGGALVN